VKKAAGACLAFALLLAACQGGGNREDAGREALGRYRGQAHALATESLQGARRLHAAVLELEAAPAPASLEAARAAWRAARVPYSRSEALRFGNWFVDEADEWLNAWPVDEGLLDYVADDYSASATNPWARLNLVAAPDAIELNGQRFATAPMQRIVPKSLQAMGDMETQVATGYHAIEFLLWGQDRNPHGPGDRPWTDFDATARCTSGTQPAPARQCSRRARLLVSLLELLIQDLERLQAQWADTPGSYGDRLVQGDVAHGLRRALFGLAAMSGEEMAGERLQVALLSGVQEEEQDCFSDDTHRSLLHNGEGVELLYRQSLADYARRHAPAQAKELEAALEDSRRALLALHAAGEAGQGFDRLIGEERDIGQPLLQAAIDALARQALAIEALGAVLAPGPLNPAAPSAAGTR
jgi:putative iron-regulated protein